MHIKVSLLSEFKNHINLSTLVMSLILVFIIYMIFYAITLCFIMFICPFVGPLIWTNKILFYLIYANEQSTHHFWLWQYMWKY
jgi:predicted RND superfamily exporter protein